MVPSKMKAIKVVDKGKAEIQEVDVPTLRDDYVLVKVKSVALNPTDWKHIDYLAVPGHTVGCDYSGTIEAVGAKVSKAWKPGDRVAGVNHGVNSVEREDGCFGEFCVGKGDIAIRIPDSLTDDEAATLGVGVFTCGQGLYQSLGLPLPGQGSGDGEWVLIYGASTATGTLAVQYAVLSGAKVVAICSPHNHALVKKLGASEAFDYKDPECAKKIREYTQDSLKKVFDCISEHGSHQICNDAVSSSGGKISYLLGTPKSRTRDNVEEASTLAYTVTGEGFNFGPNQEVAYKPNLEDFEFAKKFAEVTEKLLADSKLSVHPPKVGKEGLKGVFEGLQLLREGKVSGEKLVYHVDETP